MQLFGISELLKLVASFATKVALFAAEVAPFVAEVAS